MEKLLTGFRFSRTWRHGQGKHRVLSQKGLELFSDVIAELKVLEFRLVQFVICAAL